MLTPDRVGYFEQSVKIVVVFVSCVNFNLHERKGANQVRTFLFSATWP